MTERQLFLAIGDVDDELVAWAARPRARQSGIRWGVVAAAAAVVMVSLCAYTLWRQGGAEDPPVQEPGMSTTAPTTTPTKTAPTDLPKLSGAEVVSVGGQGIFGRKYAQDVLELLLASEWETIPATVPVWQVGNDFNSSLNLQKDLIRRCAPLFGDGDIDDTMFTTVEGTDSREAIDGGRATLLATSRYRYSVSSDHPYVSVWLQTPMEVRQDTDWVELLRGMAPELVGGMERPALRVTGGGRSPVWAEDGTVSASEQIFWVRVYDAAVKGGCAPGLKGVELYIEESMLKGVYIYLDEYYEIVGDYPTISEDEARRLLSEYCQTLQQYGEEGLVDGEVVAVELAYISHSISRLRVPFYRFLIEVPEEARGHAATKSGLKEYREIYVSAVSAECWRGDTAAMCYG